MRIDELKQRAEKGEAAAQYLLGAAFAVNNDGVQAIRWLRKAADW